MRINFIKSSSILKKFLIFNFLALIILALFTYLYLMSIKPNLLKDRKTKHTQVINNTISHIERLGVQLTKIDATKFVLSTRFLFQNLDRVQLYDSNSELIVDTYTLDLDQKAFSRQFQIFETPIDDEVLENLKKNENEKSKKIFDTSELIPNLMNNDDPNHFLTIDKKIRNDFYVMTIKKVIIEEKLLGFIVISEIANDILLAIDERRNFIFRTIFFVFIAILIFSVFLNRSILKPIGRLVNYTKSIKAKDNKKIGLEEFLQRSDEVGLLSRSINDMTKDLQKRLQVSENFSSDLAHEIRNPLTSLKGASEMLSTTSDHNKRDKLLKIINHDVERVERLITDYSQMLKDEASLSRSKMEKINLLSVIENVIEDFNTNLLNTNKNIVIQIDKNGLNSKLPFIFGVENRLEQILANLLDNAVSFSPNDSKIKVICSMKKTFVQLSVEDQGPGFNEKNINQIFDRFYSNRPKNFGQHTGLGLNIVKNIIELHGGTIEALNLATKGAKINITFPVYAN